jgi:hypothetical protein
MQIIVAGHKFKSRHDTEEEAAMAYDTLARELSGKFARYNFPLPGEQRAY